MSGSRLLGARAFAAGARWSACPRYVMPYTPTTVDEARLPSPSAGN